MIHQYLMVVEPEKKMLENTLSSLLLKRLNDNLMEKINLLPLDIRISLKLFLNSKENSKVHEELLSAIKKKYYYIYDYKDIKILVFNFTSKASLSEMNTKLDHAFFVLEKIHLNFFVELSSPIIIFSDKEEENTSLSSLGISNVNSTNFEVVVNLLRLSAYHWFDYHTLAWKIESKKLDFIKECWSKCLLYWLFERLHTNSEILSLREIIKEKLDYYFSFLKQNEKQLFKALQLLNNSYVYDMVQGYFPNQNRFNIYLGG